MVEWGTVLKTKIKDLLFTKNINIKFDSTDLILSEFPKSGVTYLSFLIAAYFKNYYKIKKEVNFFNINDYVHDVHITQKKPISSDISKYTGFKIFKTHQNECNKITKFIYLIRNPINCIQSYVDHFQNFYSSKISFSTLLRTQTYGLEAWINHVNNWTLTKRPTGVAIFKYEMLCAEPHISLGKIIKLIGLKLDKKSLNFSVNYCSRKNMSLIEDASSYHSHLKTKNGAGFVKLTSRKTDQLNTNDLNYIYTRLKQQKNLFIQEYYENIFKKNDQ